jgi:plasmid stabilization system protein ParE
LARIEVSEVAAEDVERLILTHSLPSDTKNRITSSLRSLASFPHLGVLLEEQGWEGFRFILGPWRWMVIVYDYDPGEDVVVIATVQDGRSSSAVTPSR